MSDTSARSIVQTLEQEGHAALTAVEHGAVWLVGMVAREEQSLHNLVSTSPLVVAAWDAGMASATAHGIPVVAIENAGAAILKAAEAFATGLAEPARLNAIPVVPVANSPPAPELSSQK